MEKQPEACLSSSLHSIATLVVAACNIAVGMKAFRLVREQRANLRIRWKIRGCVYEVTDERAGGNAEEINLFTV